MLDLNMLVGVLRCMPSVLLFDMHLFIELYQLGASVSLLKPTVAVITVP